MEKSIFIENSSNPQSKCPTVIDVVTMTCSHSLYMTNFPQWNLTKVLYFFKTCWPHTLRWEHGVYYLNKQCCYSSCNVASTSLQSWSNNFVTVSIATHTNLENLIIVRKFEQNPPSFLSGRSMILAQNMIIVILFMITNHVNWRGSWSLEWVVLNFVHWFLFIPLVDLLPWFKYICPSISLLSQTIIFSQFHFQIAISLLQFYANGILKLPTFFEMYGNSQDTICFNPNW